MIILGGIFIFIILSIIIGISLIYSMNYIRFKMILYLTKKGHVKWYKEYRGSSAISNYKGYPFRSGTIYGVRVDMCDGYPIISFEEEYPKLRNCISEKIKNEIGRWLEIHEIEYVVDEWYERDFPQEVKKIERRKKVKKILENV